MSITKDYIKGLSRQFRLVLMAWLVESFQEEELDADWSPTDEEKARIDAIADRMEKEGGRRITPMEFRNRAKAR